MHGKFIRLAKIFLIIMVLIFIFVCDPAFSENNNPVRSTTSPSRTDVNLNTLTLPLQEPAGNYPTIGENTSEPSLSSEQSDRFYSSLHNTAEPSTSPGKLSAYPGEPSTYTSESISGTWDSPAYTWDPPTYTAVPISGTWDQPVYEWNPPAYTAVPPAAVSVKK